VKERRFIALVDVPDAASGNTARRRIAGLLDDRETVVVASFLAGEGEAVTENSFTLSELDQLARDVLSGERRAITSPALARKLSAFALVLSRVSHAANAFNTIEGFDGRDLRHPGDRPTAAGDEDHEN
jgi:hypothetical protein